MKVTCVLPPLHLLVLGGLTPERLFKFCMNGVAERDYEVFASETVEAPFATWQNLGLMSFTNGLFQYVDPDTANHVRRFFRTRQVSLP